MNLKDFEYNSNEPIYIQIMEHIRKAIAAGEIRAHDKLPSVREMSSSLGINPNTIQRAYGELERLNITYTKRGMGSFVSEEKGNSNDLKYKMGNEIAEKFLKDMKSIGILTDEAIKILKGIDKK